MKVLIPEQATDSWKPYTWNLNFYSAFLALPQNIVEEIKSVEESSKTFFAVVELRAIFIHVHIKAIEFAMNHGES